MPQSSIKRLLIVGNPEEHHVGAHFLAAARQLGLAAEILDVRQAWSKNRWVNRLFYHLFRRRPACWRSFDAEVESACQRFKPQLLLVTGISPPSAAALQRIGKNGVLRCNYLTDDPWNPKIGAGYFWKSLPHYDAVYSPRRSNMADLVRHGCPRVAWLPFGYNPELHFSEPPQMPTEGERFACDVAIVGGADEDRLPIARALARTGLKLNLYGGYWDQHADLRPHARGFVHGRELRLAVGGATVNIGMVRQANRDGHAMRSLEFPAMGACLVAEDTPEHRELYGDGGDCVEYYSTIGEMVEKVKNLCARPEVARGLGAKLAGRICVPNRHTYAARVQTMLNELE